MRDEAVSRRAREKLRHRREVLAAARDLFSAYGFENVSMQQIADRSEFSIGTLYNLFEGKEAIYRTLLVEIGETFFKESMKALEVGDGAVEKLRNFIAVKVALFEESRAIIALYLRQTGDTGFDLASKGRDVVSKPHLKIIERIREVIAEGIRAGSLNPVADPALLAIAIDSTTSSIIVHSLYKQPGEGIPRDPETLLNLFFRPLLKSGDPVHGSA